MQEHAKRLPHEHIILTVNVVVTKQHQLVQAAHNVGRKVAHEFVRFVRLDCLSERVYEAFRSFVEVHVSRSRRVQMDFFHFGFCKHFGAIVRMI